MPSSLLGSRVKMLLRSLDNTASKYLFFQSVTLQRRRTHAWELCATFDVALCTQSADCGLRIDSVNINILNERIYKTNRVLPFIIFFVIIYLAKLGLSCPKTNLPNFQVKCRLPMFIFFNFICFGICNRIPVLL